MVMNRSFTRFPISGFRRTQYIPRFGGVLQVCGGVYDIVVFFDLVVFFGGVCFRGWLLRVGDSKEIY